MTVEIAPYFTMEELNQLAKDSKFVQRESKLKGNIFLDLIVFHNDNLKEQSLNDLSVIMKDEYDVEISKQGLHDRFNEYALLFLKNALEKMLQQQLVDTHRIFENFQQFNRVLLKDSTCFQIHDSLSEYYPGSGGSGSSASVRVQFEYDILSGKIVDLSLNAFNDQDSKDSVATIELTKEGDLIIRDLAYMSVEVLSYIAENSRFFLCRANPNIYIYETNGDEFIKIDFTEVSQYMKKYNLDIIEREVYLGPKKLKVRLILYLLSDDIVAKRLRKAKENNLKKGGDGNLSKEYKSKASLNLFITNANQMLIPAKSAWALYRLRWQIELIFKIWKSICKIAKVKKVKKHRLECYIYSKLIIIVLGWRVLWSTARLLFVNEGKALSFQKASKTLFKRKIGELRQLFVSGGAQIESVIKKFYALSRKNHILEKREEEPTSLEILLNHLGGRVNEEYLLA